MFLTLHTEFFLLTGAGFVVRSGRMSTAADPHTQRNVSLPGSQEKKASVCKKGQTHVQRSVKVLQNFISWHKRSFNHLLSPPIAQKNNPRRLLIYDVSYMGWKIPYIRQQ